MSVVRRETLIVIPDGPTAYFDVDDTLVRWGMSHVDSAKPFNNAGTIEMLVPYQHTINRLIDLHDQGYTIVVWSQGGSDWAAEVVRKLGLESFVTLCIDKPHKYIDDLSSSVFMSPDRWEKA